MSRDDAYDLMTVLLIDDEPKGLSREYRLSDGKGTAFCPMFQVARTAPDAENDLKFDDCFRLLWLASPSEAHEYFDYVMNLARVRPEVLGELGFVPDLLLFDYALTGDMRRVDERGLRYELVSDLCPLPALAAAHQKHLGIGLDEVGRGISSCPPEPPDVQAGVRNDNFGCFSGGLIFMAFDDYPCGPVALTRKGQDKTIGTEAAFFEWMLHRQSDGTFKAAGTVDLNWSTLLRRGVKAIRTRLGELARGHRVTIDLVALFDLADETDRPDLPVLTAYGLKRYPVDALFLDMPPRSRRTAAKAWADSIIAELVQPGLDLPAGTPQDLRAAERGADRLWEAWRDDKDFEDRRTLSDLLSRAKPSLTPDEIFKLSTLESYFEVRYNNRGKKGHPTGECQDNWIDLRRVDDPPVVRRWASLIVIVRHLLDMSHSKPTLKDVYSWLFPIPCKPLVLPADPSSSWKADLADLTKDSLGRSFDPNDLFQKDGVPRRRKKGADPVADADAEPGDDAREGVVSHSERRLLRSYALSVVRELHPLKHNASMWIRKRSEESDLLNILIGNV